MQLNLGSLKSINPLVLKNLFSEYSYIYIEKNSVVFSRFKKGTFKYFLSRQINSNDTCTVSFFELIVYHIPRRLSYHKCGNYTFSPYYMIHVIKILNENPAFLVQYLMREYHKIKSPYGDTDVNEFFEKLDSEDEFMFSGKEDFDVISDKPAKYFAYMKQHRR